MSKKYIFLILSIIGACTTWYFNIQYFIDPTIDGVPSGYISQTVTTYPAMSFTADLSVVGFAFIAWMVIESKRIKINYWWVLIPLTFLIALAFTCPFYLYLREKALEKSEA